MMAEFQINDRLSFRQFLGLELQHRVPDAKTIGTPASASRMPRPSMRCSMIFWSGSKAPVCCSTKARSWMPPW
ncbi:MAG: transposase [Flavobacteriales bacterium]|nr:transposase [Flavobacteriales bacterium]